MPDPYGGGTQADYIYSIYATYITCGDGGCREDVVGNTDVFPYVTTEANRRAVPYTMSEDGTIESISMYHEGGSGNVLLAVYEDDGSGYPASLIAVTPSTPVNGSVGWQAIDLPVPVEVYSGETIWLAWVYENNPGIRYKSGTPGRAHSSQPWADGMPATFGASTLADYIYSIFATYTTCGDAGCRKVVGNTDVFPHTTTAANRRAVPYTMSENGTIESMTMYHEAGSGGNMILAMYDDNGGPDALIGVTLPTTVSSSAGWQTIDLPVPVEVYSGETIWL
ncbi:MAG: hypothetical protein ACYS80_27165, partial [Planctomycetota bacterium]